MTPVTRCSRCNRIDDLLEDGHCWICSSDADERQAWAEKFRPLIENEDRSPTRSGTRERGPTSPDSPAAGRAALVENAPVPDPSSLGQGAAASPAGSVPLGPVGGAALDGGLVAPDGSRWLSRSPLTLRDALDAARGLLLDLAERDPCPDCGAEAGVDQEEWQHEDGHAHDCGVATWLRTHGEAQ